MSRLVDSSEAMEALGGELAAAVTADAEQRNCVVALRGELGSGKTTLARGFLRRLGHHHRVPSPSFALLEPYDVGGWQVFHLDLYRVADGEELEFLGLRDLPATAAICLVEWPERAKGFPLSADLELGLHYADHGRTVEASAITDRGAAVLANLGHQHI
ncbi:MAG: tRNA (adenosine(37)-N6)-threonylcarbamoyltransferase complex ATPase subunit type 1 TsaE [Gammaproteobacteria bacterium]